ncbi:DUF6369 family protein [Sediminibacter sp. Hel_I_10]|uniref:DUF6369 family protein n=1 Tax=Sediminibacter sp. Hel_I_10 TaxID=1392490 RepID=UPI00047C4E18
MGVALYILFSLLFFLLGLNCNNSKYTKLFTFIIFVFPFTNLNTNWHINFQIPIFLFFILGGLLKLRFKSIKFYVLDYKILLAILAFLFFVLITIPLALDHTIINIFKDLRFIVFGVILYVFVKLNGSLKLDYNYINKLIKWNFLLSLIIYFLLYKYEIHKYITKDNYFSINEVRYMNYATFVLPFYVLHCLANDIRISFTNWIYIIIPLLASGNRTISLILLFFIGLSFLKKVSVRKILLVFSALLSIVVFMVFNIQKISETSALFRFKKLLSLEYLVSILNTRLSPFYNALESFSLVNYFLGKGIGFTYYIPWFHYRKNLDDYNIYLDSLLPTLYGKYGLFFFLPLIFFFYFLKYLSDVKSFKYYLLLFIILSLTNSFIYQNYLTLVLLFIFLFSQNILKKKVHS